MDAGKAPPTGSDLPRASRTAVLRKFTVAARQAAARHWNRAASRPTANTSLRQPAKTGWTPPRRRLRPRPSGRCVPRPSCRASRCHRLTASAAARPAAAVTPSPPPRLRKNLMTSSDTAGQMVYLTHALENTLCAAPPNGLPMGSSSTAGVTKGAVRRSVSRELTAYRRRTCHSLMP